MADLVQYVVEDADGNELARRYQDSEYQVARSLAAAYHGTVICYEFVFDDSYPVDDFTETEEAG